MITFLFSISSLLLLKSVKKTLETIKYLNYLASITPVIVRRGTSRPLREEHSFYSFRNYFSAALL